MRFPPPNSPLVALVCLMLPLSVCRTNAAECLPLPAAPTGLESGLFHLKTIGDLTATQAMGGTSTLGDRRVGRLIYINQKPVLDFGHILDGTVVIYGRPGLSYVVESQSMIPAPTWTQRQAITLGASERFRTVTGIDPELPAEFYRGRETTGP